MGWIGTGHVHLGRLAGAGTLEWISWKGTIGWVGWGMYTWVDRVGQVHWSGCAGEGTVGSNG